MTGKIIAAGEKIAHRTAEEIHNKKRARGTGRKKQTPHTSDNCSATETI
jgi:hypothetical protein